MPGYTRSEQEMPPAKAGKSIDREEGLPIRRIGQLESLGRVAMDTVELPRWLPEAARGEAQGGAGAPRRTSGEQPSLGAPCITLYEFYKDRTLL